MENDKTFELLTKIYSELQNVKSEIKNNSNEIVDLKKSIINIEQQHGKKLESLFDGYKQNTEQLTRIEKEVSKHDEFILKRVK